MPVNQITSFANRDSSQIYPACVTTGVTTIKPNNLNTYAAADFSTDIPSLAMQTVTAGTTILAAWTSCVTSVNTFKAANANTIDIKFLDVKFHSFSGTSHTCTILFIIFRI